jgi:hypothetical protein
MFLKLFNYFVDNWVPRTYYKTGNIYWESRQEAMGWWMTYDGLEKRPEPVRMTKAKFEAMNEYTGE